MITLFKSFLQQASKIEWDQLLRSQQERASAQPSGRHSLGCPSPSHSQQLCPSLSVLLSHILLQLMVQFLFCQLLSLYQSLCHSCCFSMFLSRHLSHCFSLLLNLCQCHYLNQLLCLCQTLCFNLPQRLDFSLSLPQSPRLHLRPHPSQSHNLHQSHSQRPDQL